MFETTKPNKANCRIRQAVWPTDEAAIADIRRRVFIEEQGVPEALEWEADDGLHRWFLAFCGPDCIGIVKLTSEGRIGRMAVLPEWRGRGVGALLLAEALKQAVAFGMQRLVLHAQIQAVPFYARFGFVESGDLFEEAGIPHRTMFLEFDS